MKIYIEEVGYFSEKDFKCEATRDAKVTPCLQFKKRRNCWTVQTSFPGVVILMQSPADVGVIRTLGNVRQDTGKYQEKFRGSP